MAARLTRRRFLKPGALGAPAAGCASPPAAVEPAPTLPAGPAVEITQTLECIGNSNYSGLAIEIAATTSSKPAFAG